MSVGRYGPLTARAYDLLSGEPVYVVGRRLAIPALGLRPGERVLDVGCGTGLNLSALMHDVGPTGLVVGLDRSAAMLGRAGRRRTRSQDGRLRLVEGDMTDPRALVEAAAGRAFDAVLFTYSLSLAPDPGQAWRAVRDVLRSGARVGVVDMARPTGNAAWASPLAQAACWLGGADIDAHPWTVVEPDLSGTRSWSRWGGHVRVCVGTWGG
ncbi:class I SAM-dependent methyltransferase [Serinicoccus marinus]|uniref:class I SAM-dependent methyltransferase n=1 Tax=Serinicoccus marinus TaxID=247333 RepID=UPI002490B92D|nr:methyltransferase domain-containing protein [Serinicoccus marinus]